MLGQVTLPDVTMVTGGALIFRSYQLSLVRLEISKPTNSENCMAFQRKMQKLNPFSMFFLTPLVYMLQVLIKTTFV